MEKVIVITVVALAVIFIFFSSQSAINRQPLQTAPAAVAPSKPSQPSYPSSGGSSAQNTSPLANIRPEDLPPGFTLNDISPFYHQVRIGSAYRGYFGSYGQVGLYADYSLQNKLDITQWKLQANHGTQIIPQAIEIYSPSGLTAPTDIWLSKGQTVYLYSNYSAISQNLRLNKCIGYLQNSNKFTPALPLNCPYIDRSDIVGFTGQCQNYLLSISSCSLPASNPPVSQTDTACWNYMQDLNYSGCFSKHRTDSDFLSNEWRVWLGSEFLDPSHDRVMLLDRNGLLVDYYSY